MISIDGSSTLIGGGKSLPKNKDFQIKGGMTMPNIGSLDPGTYGEANKMNDTKDLKHPYTFMSDFDKWAHP